MAKRKLFKSFHELYDVYLLPVASAHNLLANVVKVEKGRYFDIDNRNLIDRIGFTAEEQRKYRDIVETVKPKPAKFADVDIDRQFSMGLKLPIPQIGGDAGAAIERTNDLSFAFDGVQSKILPYDLRNALDDKHDSLTDAEREDLRNDFGVLRRMKIVDELYYAERVFITSKKSFDLSGEVESKFTGGQEAEIGFRRINNTTFSIFGSPDVPFAADYMKLRGL